MYTLSNDDISSDLDGPLSSFSRGYGIFWSRISKKTVRFSD